MPEHASISNLLDRSDLLSIVRQKAKPDEQITVHRADADEYTSKGWRVARTGVRSVFLTKNKSHDVRLEDRVWTLLWNMEFAALSGPGGALVTVNPGSDEKVTSQVDVMATDEDLCLAIECKSAMVRGRRTSFQEDLAKHAAVRASLGRAINPGGSGKVKRAVVLVLWTHNAILSAHDRVRAREQNVVLLNESDLEYYETLVHHLGPAARYQFLSELVPGKTIPGLEMRVPAVRTKMGAYECYTFSIAPEYLLKVAYVAHRTARDSDIDTYQRMLTRSRLKKIAEYIRSGPDAMFPTNIVINFEKSQTGRPSVVFERARQEDGAEGAIFGWLTLRPAYKSAWIIDGQHRLYAYSYAGAAAASKGRLSVLAFSGLPGRIQQKLFVDINSEQKRVNRNLLLELHPDLHRNDGDLRWRTKAIISKAIQEVNDDADSPLFDRILLATTPKTDIRCITLTSVFGALEKPGFFSYSARANQIVTPGPFWAAKDDRIIVRTAGVLNSWFGAIRDAVPDWWDAGSAEGGGLAMNDGVSIIVDVLRSVTEHLDQSRVKLTQLSDSELTTRLNPWANALAAYFASMTEDQRRQFRQLRGNQGHATGLRHAQRAIQNVLPDFQPEGLAEFLERERANTNDAAMARIVEIERQVSRIVIGALRGQFGTDDDAWWYRGVPTGIRTAAVRLQQEDRNQRGGQENYLDFIDYRDIVHDNWLLLGETLAPGKQNQNKATRTQWMVAVNEIRKVAAHGSSGTWVSFEDLDQLTDKLEWLKALRVPAGE